MIKRRRTKALEKAARAVKDDDEFVAHVFAIARAFAIQHELDRNAGSVRRSLKAFDKHALKLIEWLDAAGTAATPEHGALRQIDAACKALEVPYIDAAGLRTALRAAATAGRRAEAKLKGRKLRNAPRQAAEALRATFEHHKLKVSYQASQKKQSEAVKLLCAIAKDGGDPTMTPAQARLWLIESQAKRAG